MISPITAVVAGVTGIYVLLWVILHFTQDKREPESVDDAVPFLSPIVGMALKGSRYHTDLRDKSKLPICTIRMPGTRLYVINDTSLIPVMQRQVRTLSFAPILLRVTSHFMGVSKKGLEIMAQEPLEDHGFIHSMMVETVKGLAPGPALDELNEDAVAILCNSLNALVDKDVPTTVDMFQWTSYQIMMATTNAIYGPQNPFRNPAVRKAFYKLEAGLIALITGFLPSILAREAIQGRDVITDAFMKYFNEGGLDNGSSTYARNRYEYPKSLGASLRDIAKLEAGGSIGLISNTMPATFWALYHTFSDPVALEDCRREVSKAVHEQDGQFYLDLAKIKSCCPILVSTMQEAFRFHSIGIAARSVEEDHMLGGKYLLKKGNTILIPSLTQHSSSQAWGSDVHQFYHKRFVRDPSVKKKHNQVAFRAFGGGATLCPGRHFASTEILAFASVFLLRFDVKPANGGTWDTHGFKEANAAFRLPKNEVKIELHPRDKGKKWHVFFSEPGKPLEVSIEDIEAASAGGKGKH